MTHKTKYTDLAPEFQRYRKDIFDDKYKKLDENDLPGRSPRTSPRTAIGTSTPDSPAPHGAGGGSDPDIPRTTSVLLAPIGGVQTDRQRYRH